MLPKEVKLSLPQARAYWAERQGVSRPIPGGTADAVRASGWMYSPGSTLPYLAFRARMAACERSEIDRAIFDETCLVEVPTVRGCTMLVPAEDVAPALTGGRRFLNQYLEKMRIACNIKDRELRDLSAAVPTLLKDGPSTMEMLRKQLPAKLVRDLGSAGKRLGERSTLTFTMRVLQRQMIVQRTAADSRLDSQTYSYRLLPPELCQDLSQQEADRALAHRFFGWAAPATLKEFAWWAGISQKEARAVMDKIGLVRVSVEGWAKEAWIPTERLEELHRPRAEHGQSSFIFLPFRDNYLYFRRGIGVFLDQEGQQASVLDWRNQSKLLGDLDSLHHNAILEGERLAGYWEYDPDGEEVVWQTCGRLHASRERKLESEVAELQDFIRTQLKDVAFYAFDGGKSRRRRIDSLSG